ncbi:ice-binding family protein [Hymenobacter sp. M29]|uniref:Ice-binding family protein n=1 Tax=Hymenobacter mellowenesis TaxID=3063995 RepID=A0ABT9AJ96_9BACT|nr:ice-binding family protein [Hymenobacter sp. M29]MDO7849945.1 ice-binding family protein [Hymenobacter sp. M29]
MKAIYFFARRFASARATCLLLAAGLLSSPASFGQVVPPAIGRASSFALFTAVGAFNNVGPSVVLGDIGTNAGAFSGFPLGVVTTGSIHVADTEATQAATDVETAYTYAAGIPNAVPLTVYGGTPQQILTPGAYVVGAATTLTGNLILDAQNDPNAVFFLRVSGALTTAAGSTVTLAGGALASNVYWQVGGLLILGQNSVMRGTLLVDGGINLIEGATLLGRGLSRSGAINMDTNVVNGFVAGAPLPVTLVRFSATLRQDQRVLLQWATASETTSRSFAVERSATGTTGWETVALLAAAGTSTAPKNYQALDERVVTGRCYYRLRSTDLDGTFALSPLRTVSAQAALEQAQLFPNPVAQTLTVTGVQPGSRLTLLDMAGRTQQQQVASEAGIEQVATSELLVGSYLLKVVSASGIATTLRLQKQ